MIESEDIRVSIKAIIVKDNMLLTAKKEDKEGYFYVIPGGGQEHSETIEDALIRECIEEISVKVKIKRLLFIRDYIGKTHNFMDHGHKNVHQVEIMFEAEIAEGVPANGIGSDTGQIGVEWLSLNELHKFRLFPKVLIPYLKDYTNLKDAVYLGDVN